MVLPAKGGRPQELRIRAAALYRAGYFQLSDGQAVPSKLLPGQKFDLSEFKYKCDHQSFAPDDAVGDSFVYLKFHATGLAAHNRLYQ
jgi:hypothetical protein